MECNVCCEKVKKGVTCNFCDYLTCTSCVSRFILETVNPSCMNCKKPWNREIITEKLGKTFVTKKYKAKRENDLFETEKALLPETQEYATRKKNIDSLNREIKELQQRLRILKAKKKIFEAGYTPGMPNIDTKEASKLTIKCPCQECRGFVNSETMVCGICKSNVCSKCHEVKKDDGHTCDPNTIETVKLLKKDTKNCPKCAVSIHKIEGCDQMYCVQCHTAFSWKTGEIVIGRIHNPHYFEYLKKSGGDIRREIGDIPCGGLTPHHFAKYPKFLEPLRMLIHIENVEIPLYRTNRIENNRDLRVKFLNNDITEKQFKTTLQRREKEIEKKQEISQILNTMVVVGSEIFRNDPTEEELQGLFEFTNDSMGKVSKLYNCIAPYFDGYKLIRKKY